MNWRDLLQRPGDQILHVLAAVVVRGILGALATALIMSQLFRHRFVYREGLFWEFVVVSAVIGFLIGVVSVRKGPGAI